MGGKEPADELLIANIFKAPVLKWTAHSRCWVSLMVIYRCNVFGGYYCEGVVGFHISTLAQRY